MSLYPAAGWGPWLSPGAGYRASLSKERQKNARPASRPLACSLERSPGQRSPAGCLWPRVPWPCSSGGSGFKFWVTVSVAPRPEVSEASGEGSDGMRVGGTEMKGEYVSAAR